MYCSLHEPVLQQKRHFIIHDLVVPKKGQQGEPLKAEPKLLIRSELQMQYDMLCELMELLQPHE